jgi:hypothetical protein
LFAGVFVGLAIGCWRLLLQLRWLQSLLWLLDLLLLLVAWRIRERKHCFLQLHSLQENTRSRQDNASKSNLRKTSSARKSKDRAASTGNSMNVPIKEVSQQAQIRHDNTELRAENCITS